jgi:hypothetical protein
VRGHSAQRLSTRDALLGVLESEAGLGRKGIFCARESRAVYIYSIYELYCRQREPSIEEITRTGSVCVRESPGVQLV